MRCEACQFSSYCYNCRCIFKGIVVYQPQQLCSVELINNPSLYLSKIRKYIFVSKLFIWLSAYDCQDLVSWHQFDQTNYVLYRCTCVLYLIEYLMEMLRLILSEKKYCQLSAYRDTTSV